MKCWQGLSFFAASTRVSLCNQPSFIAHENIFGSKFFLMVLFLDTLKCTSEASEVSKSIIWQNQGLSVTTTCIQALSCFYSACLFSHSKHVLFSLTHWYFLVRTFFRPKMLFCASICFPWNYYCIMENNAYLKIQEVGSLNGNCVWRRYTMLRRATRNDNLTPHKHGHMTFL